MALRNVFIRLFFQCYLLQSKTNPLNWKIISALFAWHITQVSIAPLALHPSTSTSVGKQGSLWIGREARLPLDLTFGISDVVTQSHNGHARMVRSSLAYAYETVRSKLGEVQSHQKTLYNQKVHGRPFSTGDKVWLFSTFRRRVIGSCIQVHIW